MNRAPITLRVFLAPTVVATAVSARRLHQVSCLVQTAITSRRTCRTPVLHLPVCIVVSGVNLAGILTGLRSGSRRLSEARGEAWGVPFPLGEGSGEGPSTEKWNLTWNDVFWCILSGSFCPCLARKMLSFPPEVVIWWTLMYFFYFWEVMNTLSELWGWWAFYCIVMQTIWCLKFWNVTKSGRGAICISVPTPNSGGLAPRNLRPWFYSGSFSAGRQFDVFYGLCMVSSYITWSTFGGGTAVVCLFVYLFCLLAAGYSKSYWLILAKFGE